jgi:hypothetical protein
MKINVKGKEYVASLTYSTVKKIKDLIGIDLLYLNSNMLTAVASSMVVRGEIVEALFDKVDFSEMTNDEFKKNDEAFQKEFHIFFTEMDLKEIADAFKEAIDNINQQVKATKVENPMEKTQTESTLD